MSLTRSLALSDLPSRPKIVLVTDQPAITQTVHDGLGTDCELFTVAEGPSAFALCAKTLPDLVLLDGETPGVNGLQVLEQITTAQSLLHIPVIVITAPVGSVQETAYFDAGAADSIAKPVNPSVLHARVRTHLLLKFQSDRLRALALRDELTGVYSRRYLEEQIDVECARAKRSGGVLSLLMIEIDHFNAYQDYYGPPAGDDALHLVARVLESKLHRPGDLIARYGGDLFACLLPATDFEPAMQLAEGIEQAVRARGIGHTSFSAAPVLTLSVGVATRRRAMDGGADALLRLTDEQRGQANQRGGGQVCGKVLY